MPERLNPQIMCAQCQHVFTAEAESDEQVTCPACGHEGLPGGVMHLSAPPSVKEFEKNWRASREADDDVPGEAG